MLSHVDAVLRSLVISQGTVDDRSLEPVLKKYREDIASVSYVISMALSSDLGIMSVHAAGGGFASLFLYGYKMGKRDLIASIDANVKRRLDHLVSSGGIGMYDADQLIADIKSIMETIK